MTTIYRNLNPGQYVILLQGNDSQSAMKKFLVAGVRGFAKRYYWRDFEPSADKYNFTELQSDIAWCAANGVLLVPLIQDKTFGSTVHPLPKGMEAYELPNRVQAGNVNGTGLTAKRWDTAVVNQFNKLSKAMAQFDGAAGFGGVMTCETSLSLENAVLKENRYTPEAYRASYLSILIEAAKNLPHSAIYWTMNFFVQNQTYIAGIADQVRAYGVQMGGPDCLPNSASLLSAAYPYYAQFRGQMRLFVQVSPPGYSVPADDGGDDPYMTMAEILQFAKDKLFVNSMFWYPVATGGGGNSWADAAAVIAVNPTINP